jgi:ABC-2 type transport system permease protein
MQNVSVILQRTLRDYRRSIFWWSVGMAFLAIYVVLVYPMISQFEQFGELLQSPVFQTLMPGIADADFTSPAGFLGIYFFTWAPLVLSVFAILFGLNVVANEEEQGTLDLLLSTQTPRWHVLFAKAITFTLAVVVILSVTAVAMIIGIKVTPELDITVRRVGEAMLNTVPVLFFMMALTLCLTTVSRSKGQAAGISTAIIVASYFINSFAQMADSKILSALEYLSYYKYYNSVAVLKDGIVWGNFLVLTAVSAVLFGLSLWFFERRDLAV